jgi:hypothetical protein
VTGRPTMLLVHSPLLTPASWDPLRPHLEAAGWRVVTLDLRPLLDAPSFHDACAAAAAAALAPPTTIAGAARGAGREMVGRAQGVGGAARGAGRDVVGSGRTVAAGDMVAGAPHLPELPWRLVSEVLPTAGGAWTTAHRVYLQLSAAYQSTSDRAGTAGYDVRRVDADHLAMATRPGLVAELLLAGQAPSSSRSASS